MTGMRILAVGATGLLGKALLPLLVKDDRIGRIDVVVHTTPLSPDMIGGKVRCASMSAPEAPNPVQAESPYDAVICLSGSSYSQTASEKVMRIANLEIPKRVIQFCVRVKAGHLVLASSINARLTGCHGYARYKREVENHASNSGVPYTIFRPALLFGAGDAGFSKLTAYIANHSLMPVFGDGNKLEQPMPVEECAAFFHQAVVSRPANRVFEIGGRDAMTYNNMLLAMAEALERRIRLVHIPAQPLFHALRILERAGLGVRAVNSEQVAHIDSNLDIDNSPAVERYRVALSPFEKQFRSYLQKEFGIVRNAEKENHA